MKPLLNLIKFCSNVFSYIDANLYTSSSNTEACIKKLINLFPESLNQNPKGWMIIYIKLKVFMIYLKKKTLLKKIMKTEILKMAKNNSKMVEAITPMDEDFANGTPIL